MNCIEFQAQLQRRLDREPDVDAVALEAHASECSTCRDWYAAAVELENTLGRSLPAAASPLATERIVKQVLAAHRRRVVYRRLGAAAIAAGVLLAVSIGYRMGWPGGQRTSVPEVSTVQPDTNTVPKPLLRANVDDAVNALSGIVNQTAEKALEPGRLLFPHTASATLLAESASLQQPNYLETPSWSEAGKGVAAFAPVASMGRFFNYFARDLPGPASERNTGS
jgi:hypothetical protein